VFIDPVSTGFSRALPGVDPQQWYGGGSLGEAFTKFRQHVITYAVTLLVMDHFEMIDVTFEPQQPEHRVETFRLAALTTA